MLAWPTEAQTVLNLGGTFRVSEPAESWRRLERLVPQIGISRLANVTGLDHIGVPVWMAVRPLAKSLTVSQGKGLYDDLARISAAMESIELHHAESYVPRGIALTWSEAVGDKRCVDLDKLPIRADARIEPEPRRWLEAKGCESGAVRLIPRDLVTLDFTEARSGCSVFSASSNGLASGNSYDEAVVHALCEVIERDQVTFWRARRNLTTNAPVSRIDLETIDDQECRELIAKCRSAGIEVFLWDSSGELGVPCFTCTVADGAKRTLFPQRASGHGCHPVRRVACCRAITEALQSRLTHISGARDDMYYSRFADALPIDSPRNRTWLAAVREEETIPYPLSGSALRPTSTSDLIKPLLAALRRNEIDEPLVIDLSQPALGVPVLKVIVPGLEATIARGGYTPGDRMRRLLEDVKT